MILVTKPKNQIISRNFILQSFFLRNLERNLLGIPHLYNDDKHTIEDTIKNECSEYFGTYLMKVLYEYNINIIKMYRTYIQLTLFSW